MKEIVDDIYTVRLIFFRCVSDIYNKKIPYYFNKFMEVLKICIISNLMAMPYVHFHCMVFTMKKTIKEFYNTLRTDLH